MPGSLCFTEGAQSSNGALVRSKRALYVFLFLLLLSCSDGFPPEFPAPDFTLKSPVTGEEVSLETIKGKPVIIYWFASW